MKFVLILLTLFLASAVVAETPLAWQKVELQERISNKVKSSIRNVLEPGQYLVEVEIEYTDPGIPKFDDLNKKGTKVSDITFDESKGDYIAFSKVGLEVPVVEDLHKEHQQRLKELHRYQESFDIFRNLDSVKIKVLMTDKITPENEEVVKNIVKSLTFPTGEVQPEVIFSKVALEKIVKPKAPAKPKVPEKPKDELSLKDILNFISRFGNAIGLIIATIILGLFAWFLLKKWADYKKALEQKPEDEKEEEPVVEEETPVEEVEETPIPLYVQKSAENFERLRHFLASSPHDAQFMLKDWIANASDDRQKALKAIVQQFSDEELTSLFKGMTDNEREKWRGFLESFLPQEEIDLANQFISQEVIRYMVDPGKLEDMELVDLLLGVTVDAAARFVTEVPEQGKVLMNLLNTNYTAKILNRLSVEQADQVIVNTLSFDPSAIRDGYAGFKTQFKEFLNTARQKPFNAKIMQMMPDFNPTKEKMLYSFLAKSGMKDEMIKIAKDYMPLDIIKDLPKDLLREIMSSMEQDKKVKLLLICESDMKETLMNSFAEAGSTAREMLDIDFKNIEADPNGVSRLMAQKDIILKDFITYARQTVKGNKEFQQDVEVAITMWVDSLMEAPALKLVA
jgi:hypothetical protein